MPPLLFFLVGHTLAMRHRSLGECDQELEKLEGLLAKWCKRHVIVSGVDCEANAEWTMQRGDYFTWQRYLGNREIATKTPVLSAGFSDSGLASLKDLKHFVTRMNGALSTDSDWFQLAKAEKTHAFLCHPCFTHFVAGIATLQDIKMEANDMASCPRKRWNYWRAAYTQNAVAIKKAKPKQILILIALGYANTDRNLWDSVFFLEELRRLGHEIFHAEYNWRNESNWVPWDPHFEIYDASTIGAAPCSVAPALMEQLSMWARRNVSMTCRSCSKALESCDAAVDVPMPTKPYCVSGDCQEGYGQQRLPGGTTYSGNFKNGKFDGKCTMEGPVAVRSDAWMKVMGEYKDGKESGNWTMSFDTGDRLEMTYKNGNIDGWTVYTWANGDQQRSRFEVGQKVEQEERKPAK
eukprot:Skav224193  [mRNA]  locus=scaffold939:202710:204206:+ [translate_table: standard]